MGHGRHEAQLAARAGFDRFYGFIGGETNQWYPTLVEDNHYTERPYSPEEGYHLSKDLADKAMSFIRDSNPVSKEYPGGFPFAGGTIRKVEVNVADDVYLDAELEFAAAMARD